MTNQLIVLGNGFDLASGLKSSYGDFLNWYLETKNMTQAMVEEIVKNIYSDNINQWIVDNPISDDDVKKLMGFNIWIILFIESKLNKHSNWQSVEDQINYYLTKKLLYPDYKADQNYYIFDQLEGQNTEVIINEKIKHEYDGTYNQDIKINLAKFFMSQLNELERQFEIFLSEKAGYKISRDGREYFEYFKNARILLVKIIESDTNQETSYNIINFNYTDPWNSRWEENYKPLSTGFKKPDGFISVHGQALDREDGVNRIIFGIDNSNISPKNSSYLFTKTFRTLVNYSDNQKPLDAVNQNVFDTNVRLIKFFGHSLGEADYSYFQQMFDYYNLYENNQLKLIFYFKKYDDRDIMEYLQEQSRIVTKLIEKYGETLDNKNHGKNLLTRLEMTKRIFIKEIK